MANLPEVSEWIDNIYQFEINDFITGGPGGNDNEPHRILANRTRYLNDNKADKNGKDSYKFKVAPATADNEAVSKGQMDTSLEEKADTHTHPYIPIGRDAYITESRPKTFWVWMRNVTLPARSEDSFANADCLQSQSNDLFDVTNNGQFTFKQLSLIHVKGNVTGLDNINTRVKITAGMNQTEHFKKTTDTTGWTEAHVSGTTWVWPGRIMNFQYDSGELKVWSDGRFSNFQITELYRR